MLLIINIMLIASSSLNELFKPKLTTKKEDIFENEEVTLAFRRQFLTIPLPVSVNPVIGLTPVAEEATSFHLEKKNDEATGKSYYLVAITGTNLVLEKQTVDFINRFSNSGFNVSDKIVVRSRSDENTRGQRFKITKNGGNLSKNVLQYIKLSIKNKCITMKEDGTIKCEYCAIYNPDQDITVRLVDKKANVKANGAPIIETKANPELKLNSSKEPGSIATVNVLEAPSPVVRTITTQVVKKPVITTKTITRNAPVLASRLNSNQTNNTFSTLK